MKIGQAIDGVQRALSFAAWIGPLTGRPAMGRLAGVLLEVSNHIEEELRKDGLLSQELSSLWSPRVSPDVPPDV